MVEAETLAKINAKLDQSSIRIATVPIALCDLLEKNARFMPAQQYKRLVENIRNDGCLTSVPFALKQGERYLILSGNHRVQAARDAGLTEIPILYTDQQLTRQQQIAIQLSHNAIAGQDDLAILRDLYDEINDVVLKEYSGLDDVVLGKMEPPSLDPLSESALEYRVVSLAFLPPEARRAEELFDRVLQEATSDVLWVNRFAEYDRMLDLLTLAKTKAGVKNTATALGLLLDVAEKHLDEIPEPAKKAKTPTPAKKAK